MTKRKCSKIWSGQQRTTWPCSSFFPLPWPYPEESTPLGSNSWNWLKCLLGYALVIEKKSFKSHCRYSIPLLYRLKWVVPLGRERGSWVLEVYHKWEVCEQSLSMRLRFVLHHFLKAICKKKYTPYNCTKGEKSSTCLIITLRNASTSGLSLTSWSPFDIFPLSHISFVAHTTEKSFF